MTWKYRCWTKIRSHCQLHVLYPAMDSSDLQPPTHKTLSTLLLRILLPCLSLVKEFTRFSFISRNPSSIPAQVQWGSKSRSRWQSKVSCQVQVSSLNFCPVPVQSGSPAFQDPARKEVTPSKRSVTHTTSSFCTPFPHLPPKPLPFFTQRVSPQVIIYTTISSNPSFKDPKPKPLPFLSCWHSSRVHFNCEYRDHLNFHMNAHHRGSMTKSPASYSASYIHSIPFTALRLCS